MKALIIVDMQNDFCPEGSLSVPEGDSIVPFINEIQKNYDLVIATQDWHPKQHKSFACNHIGRNPFETIILDGINQTLWPEHCIQGSHGAELIQSLNQDRIEVIFRKGTNLNIDSYSAFFDNGKKKSTSLDYYLKGKKVSEVSICGLAADYCVYYTAMDALELNFKTTIIDKGTKPIDKCNYERLKKIFIEKGGILD